MNLAPVLNLLQQRTGLDPVSLGGTLSSPPSPPGSGDFRSTSISTPAASRPTPPNSLP